MSNLEGKVAFVTGASRGIGRAIAVELAREGFDVVVAARTVKPGERHSHGLSGSTRTTSALPGSLEETAQLICEIGQKALVVRLDLLDMPGAVAAVKLALDSFGRVDVFVNNAIYKGKGNLQRVADVAVHDYADMLQCNVVTPLAMIKELLPSMVANKSGVVVQLSTPSVWLEPKFAVDKGGWDFGYSSSKAAAAKLVPMLAVEHPLEGSGLRFFNVEPGLVVTEIMKREGNADEFAKGFGSVPAEVSGKVIAWLSSLPVDDPYVRKFNGRVVYAPKLCEELGLIRGYKEKKPDKEESKL